MITLHNENVWTKSENDVSRCGRRELYEDKCLDGKGEERKYL